MTSARAKPTPHRLVLPAPLSCFGTRFHLSRSRSRSLSLLGVALYLSSPLHSFASQRRRLSTASHTLRRRRKTKKQEGAFVKQKLRNQAAAMKEFKVDGSSTIALALFTDVTNSKELLNSMQAGTLEPEVAFLNASLIPDVFPVLAAAHKTLLAKSRESLTTRTPHSELVYNYSGSKHITESFKRCGISDNSSYVLVARFGASLDEMKAVEKLVNGKEINLEELEGRANLAQIQKHFKISGVELGISSLADAIVCRIAARDAL